MKSLSLSNLLDTFASQAENATYTSDMAFAYATAEQGQHDDLVNAIFEAKGMGYDAPAGATRYFVEQGARLDADLGEATQISVMQIENGRATMFTMYIDRGDAEYMIQALKENQFKIITEQSCELSETSINSQEIETEQELGL